MTALYVGLFVVVFFAIFLVLVRNVKPEHVEKKYGMVVIHQNDNMSDQMVEENLNRMFEVGNLNASYHLHKNSDLIKNHIKEKKFPLYVVTLRYDELQNKLFSSDDPDKVIQFLHNRKKKDIETKNK